MSVSLTKQKRLSLDWKSIILPAMFHDQRNLICCLHTSKVAKRILYSTWYKIQVRVFPVLSAFHYTYHVFLFFLYVFFLFLSRVSFFFVSISTYFNLCTALKYVRALNSRKRSYTPEMGIDLSVVVDYAPTPVDVWRLQSINTIIRKFHCTNLQSEEKANLVVVMLITVNDTRRIFLIVKNNLHYSAK